MSNNTDFKKVTYKRPRRPKNNRKATVNSQPTATLDPNKIITRIQEAVDDLAHSDVLASVRASLTEAFDICHLSTVNQIICFGLGKISDTLVSKYQLALLLHLKQWLKCEVRLYDPAFCDLDHDILSKFDCHLFERNVEAKCHVTQPTLFYLPHCPKQLTNNLLWANWGLNLKHCLIVANSFSGIVENSAEKELESNAIYVRKIMPLAVELSVVNSFKFFDVFNDTALHLFPTEGLKMIDEDFWKEREEPKYEQDGEFVEDEVAHKS